VIPYPRDKSVGAQYFQHIGVYAFRKNALMDFSALPMKSLEATEKLEQLRYLEFGKKIKMVLTQHAGIGIDTPVDLILAKEYLLKIKKEKI
jgi:3-deoxy-manno-octulosonate cytidylyltransferase (CMP-KDO synthetase)